MDISRLVTRPDFSRFIQAAQSIRQWSKEFDRYVTNFLRLLDGEVPIDYRVISDGNKLVFSYFPPRENKLVNSEILDQKTGKYY